MTDYKAVREKDIERLDKLLSLEDGYRSELTARELDAFAGMRESLQQYRTLTSDQRKWVYKTYEKFVPQYENAVSSGVVPVESKVQLLVRDHPLRPPGRR